MFKNTYQNGLLSIFYSCGSNPLAIWDMEVKNGHIKRLTDKEVNSIVLEIVSTNVATTYISCPKNNQTLGIKLPFLVMIIKNLKRYFSFEITILDDRNMRRRFRISNFQSTTKIKPFYTSMPIGLSGGWNQIQFNLADFTRRAYGSQFLETQRVQVHANVRLRRIYFSERLYTEDELPHDYKLFLPLERKKPKDQKKEEVVKQPPPAAAPVPSLMAAVSEAAETLKPSESPTPEVKEEKPEESEEVPEALGGADETPREEKGLEWTPAEEALEAFIDGPEGPESPTEEATPVDELTTPVDQPATLIDEPVESGEEPATPAEPDEEPPAPAAE